MKLFQEIENKASNEQSNNKNNIVDFLIYFGNNEPCYHHADWPYNSNDSRLAD